MQGGVTLSHSYVDEAQKKKSLNNDVRKSLVLS